MTTPDATSLVGQIIEGLEPGAFVTKYILVAEVIDTHGKKGVWTSTGGDAERWEVLGLLHDLLEDDRAARVVERMDEEP